METKDIQFWEEAIKMIKNGYGKKPCKDFDMSCSTCQAHLVISWMEGQIDLIKWAYERKKSN